MIGLAGLLLWRTLRGARTYGWLLLIGYGATFLYGLWATGRTGHENFLSLNRADNWLHLISALAGFAIALWPAHLHEAAAAGSTRDPVVLTGPRTQSVVPTEGVLSNPTGTFPVGAGPMGGRNLAWPPPPSRPPCSTSCTTSTG